MTELKIEINHTPEKKQKPAFDNLVFGKNFTDHMFEMDYTAGRGWHDPELYLTSRFLLIPLQ